MTCNRNVSDIRIGHRHRRDLGNLDALARSIADVGLLQPILIRPDGALVAGERRLAAVRRLGWEQVPVHVVEGFDDTLRALVAERDENTCRKDFTPSEMVALGQALEEWQREAARRRQATAGPKAGRGQKLTGSGKLPEPVKGDTRDKVGAAVGMSGKTYERAKAVVEAAAAEPEKYERLREDMDRTGKVNGVYRRLERLQQAERIEAEPPPLPHGPFRVIVVDPPWPYQKRTEDASHRGAVPYAAMSLDDLRALPVASRAHEDAVLWLWTTNAHMPEAFGILRAWGFEHKTILTWAKDRLGCGDWLRGQTEHCILAARGRPVLTLAAETTLLHGRTREHSRKPDEFYALVESLCPGSKLELFARTKRDGWTTHGAELEMFPVREEQPDLAEVG
jgi:N6-adenosine-specific RNA methylase IME4